MRVKCTMDQDRDWIGGGDVIYARGHFDSHPRDEGRHVDVVQVTCSRCGHSTRSYGSSDASAKRCLVLLREECPRGERNFYVMPQ
jgi:hypothetical protein